MIQHPEREPVSEEAYAQMDEKIREHFDHVRELLADELGGEPEDYEADLDDFEEQ